jgi:hypothetical protein
VLFWAVVLFYPALRLSIHPSELRWGPIILFLVLIRSKLRSRLLRMLLVLLCVLRRRRWSITIVSLEEGVYVVLVLLV